MLRKPLAAALVISVLFAVNAGAESSRSVETVKQKVAKFGVGEKVRVIVKLANQPEVKGYVSEVGDDSFVVTKPKDGTVRTILYSDVIGVKRHDPLPLGVKIGLWAAAAFVGVAALWAAVMTD